MCNNNILNICLVFILMFLLVQQTYAAGNIEIVGSSTVYPFSAVAAERFAQIKGSKAPKVESTGSGGGLKLFCAGVGDNTPDITNASRRIKKSEQELCAKNGVDKILEVEIGYDGIAIAQSTRSKAFNVTRKEFFLALGRDIPDADGNLQPNPNKLWSDVNSQLPSIAIQVYGPPPTSGTRDAFVELVMEKGCAQLPSLRLMKKADKKKFKVICHSIREDSAYTEVGENDNIVIQKLVSNPDTLGIFGFSYLEENRDKVRGLAVEGVLPTFDSIANGDYPVSRSLFFYVKLQHYGKTEDLQEFVEFFVHRIVMGEDGFLAERGMIPLLADKYQRIVADVKNKVAMESL